MAKFQGSQSAMLKGQNPVNIEKSKKKNIENPDNPIPIHGDINCTPSNWSLVTKKQTGDSVCLTYWTPNNNGGHSINKDVIVLKYLYFDVKTQRTFVFTKSGVKYYLAKSNAYFNPNYKVASDPYALTCRLIKLS